MADMNYQVFVDLDATALEGGYIYLGQANADPEVTPIAVYWDQARTVLAQQPLRTSGGVIVRDGTPSDVFAETDAYSIRVRNRAGSVVWYKSTTGGLSASRLTFPIPRGPAGADSTVPGPPGATDPTPFLRKYEATSKPVVYDYFDMQDGAPINGRTLPTGQVWDVTGTNVSSVKFSRGNGVASTDDSNFYARIPLTYEAERAAVSFIYRRTGNARVATFPEQKQSPSIVLIIETIDSERDKMLLHYQVGSDGGSCQAGTPPFTGPNSAFVFPNIAMNLAADVEYTMAAEIVDRAAGTLMVTTPSGERLTATNIQAVKDYAPMKVTVQILGVFPEQVYELKPYIRGVTVGPRLEFSPAIAAGAQGKNTELFQGNGAMARQVKFTGRVTTTGWYRFARLNPDFTVAGFRLFGNFSMEAIANNSVWTFAKFQVNHSVGSEPAFVMQDRKEFGTPLSALRIVAKAPGESYLEAYVTVPTSGYVDLRAQSEGYHSLYVKPSLTTTTTGYTTYQYDFPPFPNAPLTLTKSVSGWYRVAIASTYSSFSVAGKIRIKATTPTFISTYAEVSIKSRYDLNGFPFASAVVSQQLANEGLLQNLNTMPVGAVRVSSSGASTFDSVAVDIYLGNATAVPVTFTIEFDDAFIVPWTGELAATPLSYKTYTRWLRDDRVSEDYITEALVNSSTKTLFSGCPGVHNTATGTNPAYTFVFPNEVQQGDEIALSTAGTITAVTITPGTGHTIVGAVTTLAAGARVIYRFDIASLTWNRVG